LGKNKIKIRLVTNVLKILRKDRHFYAITDFDFFQGRKTLLNKNK